MSLRLKASSVAQLRRRLGLTRLALIFVATIAFITLSLIMLLNQLHPSTKTKTANSNRLGRSQLEAEIITITPNGFEPEEITRPEGRFILVVDNRSGLKEITFRLNNEEGNQIKEVRMPSGYTDWDEVVELHSGNYVLKEANHPRWLSRIIITAQ